MALSGSGGVDGVVDDRRRRRPRSSATRVSHVCVVRDGGGHERVGRAPVAVLGQPLPGGVHLAPPRSVSRRRWSSGAKASALPWRTMSEQRDAAAEDESGEGGLT